MTHLIPAAPVWRVIDAELDRRGIERGVRTRGRYGGIPSDVPAVLGYPNYNAYWKARQHFTMRDTTADRLLCHLGIPEAWHTDPDLSDIYMQLLALEARTLR